MVSRSIRQIVVLAVLAALACGAPVTQSHRVAVSREQVAHAMQAAGFETTADHLQLLANVTSIPGASLRVAKVSTQSPGTALAQLNCPARECLPFYVLVQDAQIAAAPSMTVRVSNREKAQAHPLIKRGKPVTLLIENSDLRIVLPVISLEPGAQGQVIKVSSPDRKRNYKAEVMSATLVRSKF